MTVYEEEWEEEVMMIMMMNNDDDNDYFPIPLEFTGFFSNAIDFDAVIFIVDIMIMS